MFDESDPRVSGEYVRRLRGREDESDVIVVGVVHDHPASTYRVQSVIDTVEPEVLALELPPIAVPLFERYASDGETPPASGGEMSAAIQAASTGTVVGIDGPTPGFLRRLAKEASRRDVGWSTVRRLASGVLSVTRHAIACRVAATIDGVSATRPGTDAAEFDCDWSDPPQRQATDEGSQIRRAKSVKAIFGEPGAVQLRDAAREAYMADRLSALREDGTVVAVVGVDHLDPLVEHLE